MSIRLLARDLYRLQKEVELLEDELATAPMDKKVAIEAKLRKKRAERNHMRGALDGQLER